MISQLVLSEMNQALKEIESLPANWDSYGAPPITKAAIKAARNLLNALVDTQPDLGDAVRPYSVVPLASGGVQLTWRVVHGVELEVEIGLDGHLGYLLVPTEGLHHAVEEEDVSQKTVIAMLAKMLGSSPSNHAAD